MGRIVYLSLFILICVSKVRSGAFIYSVYPDLMSADSPYYQRNSTYTFSDAVNFPRNFFTLYSAPNDSYVAFQMFAETPNGLPTAPNVTLMQSIEDQFIYKPAGNLYSSVGVYLANSVAFAVVNSGFGLGYAVIGANPDQSLTEMKLLSWNWLFWNDSLLNSSNVGFPEDAVHNELTSIALAHPDTKDLVAVVLTNSVQGIFRLLLIDVTTSGYQLTVVVNSPDGVFTARPAVAPYPEVGVNTYILAYSWKISKFSYEIVIQIVDDITALTNVTRTTWSTSALPIDVQLTYLGNSVVALTYQLINETHAVVKRHLVNVASNGIVEIIDLAAVEDVSATYAIATNVMADGRLITTWAISTNTSAFNGMIEDFTNKTTLPFTLPAADPSLPIARLQIAPLSSTSFAVTQMRTGERSSSFTNYYIISNCDDGVRTMNENCVLGNAGCVDCMCSISDGYYATEDSLTCRTKCGDGIVAGNETCDNSNDVNCVSCACVQGSAWNSTDLLCVRSDITPQSQATTPSSPPSGWSNDYIAIFVVCPIGLGAAIFLAVYFGKKRKAAQEAKQKPGPDTTAASDSGRVSGTYGSVPANSVELQPVDQANASNVLKSSQAGVDKLNVPYAELKFLTEIGAGAYGKVFIGDWQRVKVALKINTSATGADFEREAKLMVELRPHPNVVQMLGVSSDGPYPVMILEYCDGGSLDTKLFDTNQAWPVAEQLRTVNGIAKGLFHLHKNQIIHRDISARNILLNFNQPKISDFGLSRLVSDTKKGSTTKSNVGPIRWMSPESLKTLSYSTKSDVWTFGIVVYEIVARQEPHADADQICIGMLIRDQSATPEIPEGCDPCLKEVMQKCWNPDPEMRPSMEEICDILDKYMEKK